MKNIRQQKKNRKDIKKESKKALKRNDSQRENKSKLKNLPKNVSLNNKPTVAHKKEENKSNDKELIYKFLYSNPYFKELDKKKLLSIAESSKIKNIRKTIRLSSDGLNNKKYKFLFNYFCFVKFNLAFFLIENNYRKIVIDIFYPNHMIDMEIINIVPECFLVLPRGTKLILVPHNQETQEILKKYTADQERKKMREYYVELINYKSLDSINRLIYFLVKYFKENNNSDELLIDNKKLISYITGNSHEVIVRNFKKLQKMNYIQIQNGKVKINSQRLEQWIKNSKIIV
ncbi:MAG: hypothetical protein RMJ36_00570 [Candidatus Calescibacterium sp.]|nr:hypothetical protein [Candidatus Calescibacterium sp.]MDW8132138.1 hypothetical protein [Candidatus Calescibacterium sp.]